MECSRTIFEGQINPLNTTEVIKDLLLHRNSEYGGFDNNVKFAMKFYDENIDIALYPNSDIAPYYLEHHNMFRYFLFMISAKLARLQFNPTHEDSIRDLQGYVNIYKCYSNFRFELRPIAEGDHAKKVAMINAWLRD